jgi:hypothetical protein
MHLASAMDDTDFNTTSMSLDFAVGSMPGDSYCINVNITEDSALVGEIFNVELMLTTSDPNVVLGNNMTTVTITDDDSECAYVLLGLPACAQQGYVIGRGVCTCMRASVHARISPSYES